MKDKLEVGMYARTEKGTIFKVSSVNEIDVDGMWYKALMGNNVFKDILINPPFKFEIINKASHNITDLIEVGDYVNGNPVCIIKEDEHNRKWIYTDSNYKYGYLEEDIKSILTHEQMEQMAYKVG